MDGKLDVIKGVNIICNEAIYVHMNVIGMAFYFIFCLFSFIIRGCKIKRITINPWGVSTEAS